MAFNEEENANQLNLPTTSQETTAITATIPSQIPQINDGPRKTTQKLQDLNNVQLDHAAPINLPNDHLKKRETDYDVIIIGNSNFRNIKPKHVTSNAKSQIIELRQNTTTGST